MAIKDKIAVLANRSFEVTRIDSEEDNTNAMTLEVEDPIVYKVYKRRWIGVVIIMLLNIVSSWRYIYPFHSSPDSLVGSLLPLWQESLEITSVCRLLRQ